MRGADIRPWCHGGDMGCNVMNTPAEAARPPEGDT
jgi:hypothetical protein